VAYLSPTAHAAPGPEPTPEQAAAGIATAVLSLWTPFTLIIALVLSTQPYCTDPTKAPTCTPLGHLAALWTGPLGASLGLLVAIIGCWPAPRRHPALWALAGLTLAASGLLATLT
jgi:hypothetical protein